ncbi:2-acylglycerol O-acyltransferase 1-like isoform X1 [Thrips palmi]|uniref:Acyltransferase n=1 Tax=Thrips palmi TaxID=161013 RepID=A0A6P8Y907_THRPL|nr:2-acylglycerol O-acyltransferase 1-like isoform X1 [Thrips palmi]
MNPQHTCGVYGTWWWGLLEVLPMAGLVSIWFFLPLAVLVLLLLPILALRVDTAWLPLLLCCWAYYDRHTSSTGGRRWYQYGGSVVGRCVTNYFPLKVVKADGASLDPRRNYIADTHPHGPFQTATMAATLFGDALGEAFPGISFKTAAVRAYFVIPVVRELALAWGLISVSERSIRHVLCREQGTAVLLFSGSADETLRMRPDVFHVYLKRRGFCRLALQEGASLLPILILGKNRAYSQPLSWLQDWVHRVTGRWVMFPVGRGLFETIIGYLPHRVPHTFVVGAPLHVEKVRSPTKAQIEDLHAKHAAAIERLYKEYSPKFFPGSQPLIIER